MRYTLLLILLAFYFPQTLGQTNGVRFESITVDEGLSQNSANVFYQDAWGFLWIGTQDGLNRFDGHDFEIFRNEAEGESISNNYIWDVCQDNDSIIWVATFGGGLCRVDLLRNTFRAFNTRSAETLPSDRIFSISEGNDDILWLGSNEGLIRFNKQNFTSELFLNRMDDDGNDLLNYVGNTALLGEYIWCSTDSGLVRINRNTLHADSYTRSPFSNSANIGTIQELKTYGDYLYVACGAGLLRIGDHSDTLLLPDGKLGDALIQDMLLSKENTWYIATDQGLFIWETTYDIIDHFTYDPNDNSSLTHNNIISVFQSKDGVIWLGTRNGISIIPVEKPDFNLVRSIPGKGGLASSHVNSFIERENKLWIGTNKGIQLLDLTTSMFRNFLPGDPGAESFRSGYVLTMYEDINGMIWVGTKGGGVYHLDTENERLIPVSIPGGTDLSVHQFLLGDDGTLWIGTSAKGLWNYNPEDGQVRIFGATQDSTGLSHTYVFCLEEDVLGRIWMGTPTGGLNMYDPTEDIFIHFQNNPAFDGSLSNDIVLDLHIDDEDQLWVSTVDGLNKLSYPLRECSTSWLRKESKSGKLFEVFNQKAGFTNTVIYGVTEDNEGRFWITTNGGLALFSPIQKKVLRTFDQRVGLQSNEFNQNSFYRGESGRIFIGGVNGFNFFYPDSIKGDLSRPVVHITGLSILNEPVLPGVDYDHGLNLDKSLLSAQNLSLSYKHRVVTFHFTSSNFINPNGIEFHYKLEGFDDSWIKAGSQRSVTYTNLDPGNYTFMVRAVNANGIWNDSPEILHMSVSPPPWATWYAYTLYILVLLTMVLLFVRYRVDRATRVLRREQELASAKAEARELFRKQSAADFHDEAGKYLTKINLFTELAKSDEDPAAIRDKLQYIHKHTASLSGSMRDFLWSMDAKMDNASELVQKLIAAANDMFEGSNISLISDADLDSLQGIPLSMSARRAALQIGKEAFLNIVKHAHAEEVIIRAKIDQGVFRLSCIDDGTGFTTEEEKPSGHYGLSQMQDKAERSGGKVRIDSAPGKGTQITIEYQTTQMGE